MRVQNTIQGGIKVDRKGRGCLGRPAAPCCPGAGSTQRSNGGKVLVCGAEVPEEGRGWKWTDREGTGVTFQAGGKEMEVGI